MIIFQDMGLFRIDEKKKEIRYILSIFLHKMQRIFIFLNLLLHCLTFVPTNVMRYFRNTVPLAKKIKRKMLFLFHIDMKLYHP